MIKKWKKRDIALVIWIIILIFTNIITCWIFFEEILHRSVSSHPFVFALLSLGFTFEVGLTYYLINRGSSKQIKIAPFISFLVLNLILWLNPLMQLVTNLLFIFGNQRD